MKDFQAFPPIPPFCFFFGPPAAELFFVFAMVLQVMVAEVNRRVSGAGMGGLQRCLGD